MDFYSIRIIDIIDIVLVAILLYYVYKLVKGTVAINIFIGIVIVYAIWKITELMGMTLLSKILGGFLGAGMFALIVVFQQEIRRFLLLLGSTNFASGGNFFKRFNLLSKEDDTVTTNLSALINALKTMSTTKTGALIVIKRNNNLDFVKQTGDAMQIEVNQPILESIFYKNSPLHDGAIIIEDNTITATRVILPISNDKSIPHRFGLRHRAAIGITEKTDAVCIVVSEENGSISYFKDGQFVPFSGTEELQEILHKDLKK